MKFLVPSAELFTFATRFRLEHSLFAGPWRHGLRADASCRQTATKLCQIQVIYAVAHVRGGGELGRDWLASQRLRALLLLLLLVSRTLGGGTIDCSFFISGPCAGTSLKLRREEGRYLKVKNRFHDFIAAAQCSASCHFPFNAFVRVHTHTYIYLHLCICSFMYI